MRESSGSFLEREPGREREEDADEGDHPVPELDEGVVPLLRVRLVPAARPVLAAEPGAGQPHERAGGHDEEERAARRRGEPEEPPRRHEPEAGGRRGRH